jgi:hypothetical protein
MDIITITATATMFAAIAVAGFIAAQARRPAGRHKG